MRKSVYLAGPITGLTYGQADEWRGYARGVLDGWCIDGFSPMRAQGEDLSNMGVLQDVAPEAYDGAGNPMLTEKAVFGRDHWDVKTCDLVLVNMLNAQEKSGGTFFEIAWAFAYHKPIVLVMEPNGNPNDHTFVRQSATFRVEDLDVGLAVVRSCLLPWG
jgi:nucleoside 2-deoxyribosyltransferase